MPGQEVLRIDARELVDFAKLRLPKIKSQIPYALAGALNDCMYASRAAVIQEMAKRFDRPTPWVMHSLRYQKATKADLRFVINANEAKDGRLSQAEVLKPEIAGGGRPMKASEATIGSYWVPGQGARLDRYGNVPAATIASILSQLEHGEQVRIRDKRGRTRGPSVTYFRQGNSIYQRSGRQIVPVLVLTRPPIYKQRLPYGSRIREVVASQFAAAFNRRYQLAVRTMRRAR
jgi:hypothetical protein